MTLNLKVSSYAFSLMCSSFRIVLPSCLETCLKNEKRIIVDFCNIVELVGRSCWFWTSYLLVNSLQKHDSWDVLNIFLNPWFYFLTLGRLHWSYPGACEGSLACSTCHVIVMVYRPHCFPFFFKGQKFLKIIWGFHAIRLSFCISFIYLLAFLDRTWSTTTN